MGKPTPGPWTKVGCNKDFDGESKYFILNEERSSTHEEMVANARLLAAAPEMLSALEAVMKEFAPNGVEGMNSKRQMAIGGAMNAIAKAKGGDK